MPSKPEVAWSEEGTSPDRIEAALRSLLAERASEGRGSERGLVPARVLNMIVFVEHEWRAQTVERLRGVGRYHASRTVLLSYERERTRLDARVALTSVAAPENGELALLRESVLVEIGERHLDDLPTIADPLVISDLPTLLWAPYGEPAAADSLLGLAQATLIDSVAEPDRSKRGWHAAIERACELSGQAYVVDLAWLRSTPWRERVAATFDPESMRSQLQLLRRVTVTHHPDSTVAAMLLLGWLASRLGWGLDRAEILPDGADGGRLSGHARADGRDIELQLRATPRLQVPGLEGLELESESGLQIALDRGRGGLRSHWHEPDGHERAWTLLGASRGEGGILGEGIRQALLRDPTYKPALDAAHAMLP
jgi:Glucose-6-phosphate dehydrogenase subunit C-terminal domain/Glucose-6-phosphate dehydrogenase subunit N-terminal domain